MYVHSLGPYPSYWTIRWKRPPWDVGLGHVPPSSTISGKPPGGSRLSTKGRFQSGEPRFRRLSAPRVGKSRRANLRRSAVAIIQPHYRFPRDRRQKPGFAPDRVSSTEAHDAQACRAVAGTNYGFAADPSDAIRLGLKGQRTPNQWTVSSHDEGRIRRMVELEQVSFAR